MQNLLASITFIVGVLSSTVRIVAHPIRSGSNSRTNSTATNSFGSLGEIETKALGLLSNSTAAEDGVQDKAYTLRKGIFGGAAAGAAVGIAVGMDPWSGPEGSQAAARLTLSPEIAGPNTYSIV